MSFKGGALTVLVAIVILLILISVGHAGWLGSELEVAEVESEKSTVIGKVYMDSNRNLALDYGDTPADGVKVLLQKAERIGEAPALSTTMVDETTVKNGEYRFTNLKEGKYSINIVYQYSSVYGLPYNKTYFLGDNPVEVKKEKIVLGPTILLGKLGDEER